MGVHHLVFRVCHEGGPKAIRRGLIASHSPSEVAGKHGFGPAEGSGLVCHSAKDHLRSWSQVGFVSCVFQKGWAGFRRVPPLSAWRDGSKVKVRTFGKRSEVKKKRRRRSSSAASRKVMPGDGHRLLLHDKTGERSALRGHSPPTRSTRCMRPHLFTSSRNRRKRDEN